MALHPDLLDKHLLLLSRPAILNPPLAFPTRVRYTYAIRLATLKLIWDARAPRAET